MVIVGFEQQQANGPWNWILQNSWGADWADSGFFRIEAGINLVGIEENCPGGAKLKGVTHRELSSHR